MTFTHKIDVAAHLLIDNDLHTRLVVPPLNGRRSLAIDLIGKATQNLDLWIGLHAAGTLHHLVKAAEGELIIG